MLNYSLVKIFWLDDYISVIQSMLFEQIVAN